MRNFFLFAALAAVTAACSSPAPDAESSDEALSGKNVDATNCEVFVDKVQPILDSHGARAEELFIKTLNSRLDGPIAQVGIRYRMHDPSNACRDNSALNDCDTVGKVTEVTADRFQGAKDYFSLFLEIGDDFTFPHQYEGVIFVKTTRGTTYSFKTASHGSFFLDDRGLDDVMSLLQARGDDDFFSSADIAKTPVTADYYPYLNPGRCR
jgi:hypothetical protein